MVQGRRQQQPHRRAQQARKQTQEQANKQKQQYGYFERNQILLSLLIFMYIYLYGFRIVCIWLVVARVCKRTCRMRKWRAQIRICRGCMHTKYGSHSEKPEICKSLVAFIQQTRRVHIRRNPIHIRNTEYTLNTIQLTHSRSQCLHVLFYLKREYAAHIQYLCAIY